VCVLLTQARSHTCSCLQFAADKAARQREPGQIKDGESIFTFVERVPLGLDLTEVRISRENGGNRVAVKGIKPEGQAFEMPNMIPGLILQVVQGEPVSGMTADATIKLVIAEKRRRDAEGKNLQLIFRYHTFREHALSHAHMRTRTHAHTQHTTHTHKHTHTHTYAVQAKCCSAPKFAKHT